MAIHAPSETLKALGGNHLPNCESRSLYKDRFADPMAREDARKQWFTRLIGKNAAKVSRSSWLPAHADPLHARLISRLMVDLAGGVMENANLNLDRYGLPRIPGSAVKGCARRMALQALHDWIAAGTERPASDDACAPCCEGFTTPAAMLSTIARVFGWTPEDWSAAKKDDLYKSDFAWACGGNADILQTAKSSNPPHDTFAGTIAFLEAAPHADPGLELDVVTPHHTLYHSPEPDRTERPTEWQEWKAHRTAPDTEDPVPVFFPAVKAQTTGNYFTFPLIPLRHAASGDLALAKRWLAHGLELFGIGAKTAAGYGAFEVPELEESRNRYQQLIEEARAVEAAKAAQKAKEEKAAANAHLLAIPADASLLERFAALKPEQLRAAINKFQFEEKFWPKAPAEEASDSYQVSLFVFLSETNRSLYDAEKSKPKSKIISALQKLADKYARTLPE